MSKISPADADKNIEFIKTEMEAISDENLFADDFWEEVFERANDFWSDPDRCPF